MENITRQTDIILIQIRSMLYMFHNQLLQYNVSCIAYVILQELVAISRRCSQIVATSARGNLNWFYSSSLYWLTFNFRWWKIYFIFRALYYCHNNLLFIPLFMLSGVYFFATMTNKFKQLQWIWSLFWLLKVEENLTWHLCKGDN